MKLYTYPNNAKAFKGLVAAQCANVKVEVPAFKMGTDNRSPEFLKKNPLGRVPTLETPQGCVFESNAIARHIARQAPDGGVALLGSTLMEQSQVDQWMAFANTELELPCSAWIYPIFGYIPYSKEGTARAQEDVRRLLGLLDEQLRGRTFLVGDRFTLADVAVACTLLDLYKNVLDPKFRKKYENTNRWFQQIVALPEFVAVAGETKLCSKMEQYQPPSGGVPPAGAAKKKQQQKKGKAQDSARAQSSAPAGAAGGGGKIAELEAKVTEQGAKIRDLKKAKATKDAITAEVNGLLELKKELEAAYLSAPVAPGGHPFDNLPSSSFDLESFKQQYSSQEIRVVNKAFWKAFDSNGYSLWFCKYKYNTDLSVTYKASELVAKMLKSLTPLKKYAFSSMLVTGADNDLEISGVWIFRGSNVPKEVDTDSSFEWKKLTVKGQDKKTVEDYWARSGKTFGSKQIADGKTFT